MTYNLISSFLAHACNILLSKILHYFNERQSIVYVLCFADTIRIELKHIFRKDTDFFIFITKYFILLRENLFNLECIIQKFYESKFITYEVKMFISEC